MLPGAYPLCYWFCHNAGTGQGYWQVFVAVGLTMWVNVARMVRGQVLAMRELEFVQAARVLGYTHTRIMFRHIPPNISGPLLVLAAEFLQRLSWLKPD